MPRQHEMCSYQQEISLQVILRRSPSLLRPFAKETDALCKAAPPFHERSGYCSRFTWLILALFTFFLDPPPFAGTASSFPAPSRVSDRLLRYIESLFLKGEASGDVAGLLEELLILHPHLWTNKRDLKAPASVTSVIQMIVRLDVGIFCALPLPDGCRRPSL